MRRVIKLSFICVSLRHVASAGKVDAGAENVCTERGVGSSLYGTLNNATVLPAVRLALRVVNPCQEFPATPVGVELPDHRDPCVLWREYYSFDHGKPYYHNLRTNDTAFAPPSGFKTRFALFHRRQGLHVDAEARVHTQATVEGGGGADKAAVGGSEGNGGSPPLPGEGGSLTTRQKLAAYGGGGLLLYIIVHNILLAWIFFSLYFLHFDLVGLARSYGFRVGGARTESSDGDNAAVAEKNPSFWATLGVSILLNKLLVPLEFAVTLMMAPMLVPRLQPFASRIIPRIKSFMKG
ncbi:uncharacterized protein Tco025E_10004 [Trypanosoma conorhini]|uniref:WW domain-containing protein n=1 Tax=Trypanosoma conorhini TaxID=83891 RepID=A0A3R7MUF8_9TRYP|nr:uncharacterized protein Tco025E_10004 [Trypanosoma conorhini]RNE95490.1 hypothetical protein Tco025E_10004 [Trypanosoma conorhini]